MQLDILKAFKMNNPVKKYVYIYYRELAHFDGHSSVYNETLPISSNA